MKKLTALLLALILCLGLAACSRKTEFVPDAQEYQTPSASQEETEETNPQSANTAVTEESIQLNY